jgi:SP family xylose:H+ symportor-like MFS transporter
LIALEPRPDPGQTAVQTTGRLTPALIGSAMVAALGGLLFGFDTAVISGTTDALTSTFKLTSSTLGFTVASALLGTIIGSVIAGKPTDRWGRKRALLVLAVGYFVTSLGSALAWNWTSFVAFRLLGGLAVGGASVVSPLYIAEISPARYRGRLVGIMQFNVVLGILVAFLSNYLIGQLDLGEARWRWMLGVQAVPSAIFFVLLFPTPESPRWLITRGRTGEARAVMAGLGVGAAEIDSEVAEIVRSIEGSQGEENESLFQHKYRRPIYLAVAIAAFNQLSGINALMYYAPTIFKMAGAGGGSALLQAVALGGTNLLFTMLAMTVIDRFGRRKLILIGSVGYLISLVATAWAFYTYGTNFTPAGSAIVLAALILFIASHAFGQGAVIWVFISEIFPNRVRARGQALGSFTHWAMAALVSWTFPIIAERSGGHAFAFYAAMMCLQLLWALFLMPETKGVPLEEIQKRLGID